MGTKVQLHKMGHPDESWNPTTTGDCVELTTFNTSDTTSMLPIAITDNVNTALKKLENQITMGNIYRPRGSVTPEAVGSNAQQIFNNSNVGDVYNLTGDFQITSDFIDYNPSKPRTLVAGTNIAVVKIESGNTTVKKFDSLGMTVVQPDFGGATSLADGSSGLVKKPLKADRNKVLCGDGNWESVSTIHGSSSAQGGWVLAANTLYDIDIKIGNTVVATITFKTPPDSTYTNGAGLSLSGGTFSITNMNTSSGDQTLFLNQKGEWAVPQTGTGTVTSVKVGTTSYSPTSGVVSLPAYPTTLPASDVQQWAKELNKPSYTYSEVGAASSDHTHTLSIATSTDTNQISLSANTKYKLTAGGSTYVFKTPVDNDTTYSVGYNVTYTTNLMEGIRQNGTVFSLNDAHNHSAVYVDSTAVLETDSDAGTKLIIKVGSNTSADIKMLGKVGIGGYVPSGVTAKLYVDGNVYATGNITSTYTLSSDIKLKKDITDFDGFDILDRLDFKKFKWNEKVSEVSTELKAGSTSYGVIAQDSDGVIDGFVFDMNDKYKGVHYEKLIPIMAQAIKDLKKEINELKNKTK